MLTELMAHPCAHTVSIGVLSIHGSISLTKKIQKTCIILPPIKSSAQIGSHCLYRGYAKGITAVGGNSIDDALGTCAELTPGPVLRFMAPTEASRTKTITKAVRILDEKLRTTDLFGLRFWLTFVCGCFFCVVLPPHGTCVGSLAALRGAFDAGAFCSWRCFH